MYSDKRKPLKQEYKKTIEGLHLLEEVCDVNEIKNKYEKQLKDNYSRLEKERFSMALIGIRSSGKSTLINALINKEGLLPTKTIATTAVITKIRHGEEDKIEILFKGKEDLKKEKSRVIKEILNLDLVKYSRYKDSLKQNLKDDLFEEIEINLKEQFEDIKDVKKIMTIIDKLQIINNLMDKDEPQLKTERIDRLEEYVVESLDGSTFNATTLSVKEVIIYLKSLNLPEDFELVDLPGLGTEYKYHDEVSLKYAKEAHIFALLTKDAFDSDGFANSFLPEVQNSVDLERAFWILTACDNGNTEKVMEGIEHNKNYLRNKSIEVKNIYTTSALNYFNPDNKSKLEIDNLRKDILDYLHNKAKEDFYKKLEEDLKEIKKEINSLKEVTEYKKNKELYFKENYTDELLKKEAEERSKSLKESYENNTIEAINEIREKLRDLNVWQEENKEEILNELDDKLNDNGIKIELTNYSTDYRRGLDGKKYTFIGGLYRNRIIEHIDNIIRFHEIITKNIKDVIENKIETELKNLLYKNLSRLENLKGTIYENKINKAINEFKITEVIKHSIKSIFDAYDEYIVFINDELYKLILKKISNNETDDNFNKLLQTTLGYKTILTKSLKENDLIEDSFNFYKLCMKHYLYKINDELNVKVINDIQNELVDCKNKLEGILGTDIQLYESMKSSINIEDLKGVQQKKDEQIGSILKGINGEDNDSI